MSLFLEKILGDILIMKKFRQVLFSLLLIPLSILVCFALLELLLTVGIFDNEDGSTPVYIPTKFIKINAEINRKNSVIASYNRHGFNDRPRQYIKTDGTIRIAVLGDSFIWGDGVNYDTVWSHKLEKKFLELYENIEVLSWGKNAWSTKDELNFLKNEGIKYDIDLLIVGFVTNDPDLHNISQKQLLLNPAKKYFPNSISFITSYINRLTAMYFHEYGYANWEKRLYSDDNLTKYRQTLEELFALCQTKSIKLLFVLTPNNYAEHFKEKYSKITPFFKEIGIQYLNLYPIIYRKFYTYNPRELWANPANGHPNELVTSVYANETFEYLMNQTQALFPNQKPVVKGEDSKVRYINGEELLNEFKSH